MIWYYSAHDTYGHLSPTNCIRAVAQVYSKRHDSIEGTMYERCPNCWRKDAP